MTGHGMNPNAILLAAAKASVPGERLPQLVRKIATDLSTSIDTYRRSYECVYEDASVAVFLVEQGHWTNRRSKFEINQREADAVKRAHAEHLKLLGTRLNRRTEFETALELREAVVIPQ